MTARMLAMVATVLLLAGCGSSPVRHRYEMPGVAMEPTIMAGDTVEVVPADEVRRGDIVVAWFDGPTGRERYVYRVVGLPGERISTTDLRVYIDDRLLDEPYLAAGVETEHLTPTTIGSDQYYLLGDNRGASTDSRGLGTVARKDIVEVVVQP